MLDSWRKLLNELERGRKVFIVLVVASTRGSPGTPGSFLLVTEDEQQTGSIGGGCMEQKLIGIARNALRKGDFSAQITKLEHRNTRSENESGLICGGSQTNLLALVGASHYGSITKFIASCESDQEGALSISRDNWVFESDRVLPKTIQLEKNDDWCVCLSTLNRKRIAIFGGGHCGSALAQQMVQLGFSVLVIEPREDLFTLKDVSQVACITVDRYEAGASQVKHPEMTFAVVMTPSAKLDIDALQGILKYPFPFVGVMGSAAKLNLIKHALQEAGFNNEAWERVTAPVGLSIESDTPIEIALSVSAQIIRESRALGLR